MFQKHTVEIEWAGRPLKLETGRIARQADGAVLATYGGTSVLATAVAAKEPRAGIDFFPLTVNYQEKTFAERASRAYKGKLVVGRDLFRMQVTR